MFLKIWNNINLWRFVAFSALFQLIFLIWNLKPFF